MTHIEQLHLEAINNSEFIAAYSPIHLIEKSVAANKSAEITEQIACEFSEWCRDRAVREYIYGDLKPTNNWELRTEQKIVTTKQLFQEYLKSKEK